MTKSYPIIFQDFSIAGIRKQREYQNQLGQLIRNSDASDSLGNIYVNNRIVPQPSNIGCKTETRRLTGLKSINKAPNEWRVDIIGEIQGKFAVCMRNKHQQTHSINVKCPYGVKGDELWVRETYRKTDSGKIFYKADKDEDKEHRIWKSPLYMPKLASRITLQITRISIERLHEIKDADALREGVTESKIHTARGVFKNLWSEMHGEASWDLNPWLWVLKFSVKEFKL